MCNNKKLAIIDDIDKYLDSSGKLTDNLYNHQGTLLCPKGREPKNPDHLPPLYAYVVHKIDACAPLIVPSKEQIDEHSDKDTKDREYQVLEKTYGTRLIKKYNESSTIMDDVLSQGENEHTIADTRSLIDDSSQEDLLTLSSCIHTIREVDSYTLHHSLVVGIRFDIALHILRAHSGEEWFFDLFKSDFAKISFAEESIKHHAVGALLHDFGKTAIDQSVLKKSGHLTVEEFKEIKKHPILGIKKLQKINVHESEILSIVGNHHADYLALPHLGQGPLEVICSIIDIHDACRSKRCYKNPMSWSDTIVVLTSNAKRHRWNPILFRVVVKEVLPVFEKEFAKIEDQLK